MNSHGLRWVVSSHSANNGNCVEVAHTPGVMFVRDTKDRTGPVLSVPADTWHGFMHALREG